MSLGWPRHARKWSANEIAQDALVAREDFRRRRFGEPLSRYLDAFSGFETANRWLIDRLEHLLGEPVDTKLIAAALKEERIEVALRYLGAPPISADDLKTLSDSKLAWTKIEKDPQQAQAVRDVIRAILDPKRFPWIKKRRKPTASEKSAAVLASSVLAAAQRVQTARRGDEKALVESAVKGLLVGLGWREETNKPKRGIQSLRNDAPPRRSFMVQVNLASDNADLVVALDDGRLLAIECKGSNSEINSRKRLNKEAVQNARAWNSKFGQEVVSAAAIQGVFKPVYIEEAQETPMVIFWGHRLDDLKGFIEACR